MSDRYFSSTEYQNFNSKAIILSKVESKEAIEATSSLKKVIIIYLKVKLWRWFKPGELDGELVNMLFSKPNVILYVLQLSFELSPLLFPHG